MQGKNVVFISDDANSVINTKFKNIIPAQSELRGYLVIKTNVINTIDYLNGDLPRDTDVVILDIDTKDTTTLKKISNEKQIGIIIRKQVYMDMPNKIDFITKTNDHVVTSDFILSVKRNKIVDKISVLDKIRNNIFFWLPKIVGCEKLTLQVVKNRKKS